MVLAGVVSLFVASYPRLALRELRTLVLEPAAFYVIARSALRGPRDGLRLAGVFTAGATVASALAIGQTLTGRGLVAAEGVTRAGALYPSPNNLALLLDRAVPLAASLGLAGHGSFAVAAVVCGMALFFTFSKGAWLGTGVGMAMLAMTVGSQLPPRQRRRALAIAIAAVVPVLIVAAAMAARFERLRSGVTGVFRIYLWRSSLDMIKDHPLWGVGLDQFLYHYPRYILPEAWREPNLSHPHNLLLDFWLSLGILGLLALLWSAWRFVRLVRLAPVLTGDSPVRRAIARGAAASGVALLAHGFVDNSYFVLDLAYATLIVLLLAELAGDPIGQNDHALG